MFLCQLRYVNIETKKGRGSYSRTPVALNLVFLRGAAARYGKNHLRTQQLQRLHSVLLQSVFWTAPIPAEIAFKAIAHSKRLRSIAQATSLDLVMSPLTSRLEAEQPPLQ